MGPPVEYVTLRAQGLDPSPIRTLIIAEAGTDEQDLLVHRKRRGPWGIVRATSSLALT